MQAWIQHYRRTWVAAVCLVLLAIVLYGLETSLRTTVGLDPGVSFAFGLPLLLGMTWLSPKQIAVTGVVSWLLNLFSYSISNVDIDPNLQFRLVARLLFIGLFVWMTSVVSHRDHNRELLVKMQAELQVKLTTSLKAAALVHEIRQPLTALQLHSRMLLQRLEQGNNIPAELQRDIHALNDLSAQTNRRIAAVSSLLGCVKTDQQPIDFAAVVQASLSELAPRFEANSIRLVCSPIKHPLLLRGDGNQLSLLCNNLLTNAITALEQIHPSERRVAIDLAERPGAVQLVIADSGPGLPSTDLEQLLLQPSTEQGLGLGLFLCQTIAAHHNGTLTAARSEALGGAELKLTLAADSDAAPRRGPTRDPIGPAWC